MVKVTVVDVVSLMRQEEKGNTISVLVLLDEAGRRALGIWIGQAEAAAITMGLSKSSLPRPMTMNFMASILQAAGATLEEVRIEELKDDIFYAIAKIRSSDTIQELDARPSDAVALAVVTDSPVYVSEEILERCATALPQGKTLHRKSAATSVNIPASQSQAEHLVKRVALLKEQYKEQLQRVLDMLMV
jgi:bifunctional DNase/RNase